MGDTRNIDVIGAFVSQEGALSEFYLRLKTQVAAGDALVVDTVFDMVDRIERRLGSGLKIKRLRVFGHAAPGVQGVGVLRSSQIDISTGRITDISVSDAGRFIMANTGPPLDRLTGRFAGDGWVELHGCNVAAGAAGTQLLEYLARLWNVTVKGSQDFQYPGGGLEGRTKTARPPNQNRSPGN